MVVHVSGPPVPAGPVPHEVERLGRLDSSFLLIERDEQQLHVGSVLLFEGPAPTCEQLRAVIEAKLAWVPRYRQRVLRVPWDFGSPVWADDPDFDVRHHVRHTVVPAPGDDRALQALAEAHLSRPLDLTRPLWEMWLVTGVADGRWAILNKGHHAMIDGISGTDIMSVLLDASPGDAAPTRSPEWCPQREPTPTDLVLGSVTDAVTGPIGLVRWAARELREPRRAVRSGLMSAYGLTRLGAKMVRQETVLDGPLGQKRRWAWVRTDLAEVKQVKDVLGGTVNDVVLAAVTGGLRTFLLSRGEDVTNRTVRTMVPVSTRRANDGSPGNQVSAVFADLPVGIADPLERLLAITDQLQGLKRSGMAEGMSALLAASDFLPPTMYALAVRAWSHFPQRSISTVATNVPGPQRPLYFAGRRMLEMFPYIPLASQVRVTVGIMSYDGNLTFGVTGDRDAVPDLEVLADGIAAALAELVEASAER